MFDYSTLHPAYGKMFAVLYRLELDEKDKTNALKQLAEGVSGLWGILDAELAKKKFITGDQPTVVDYLATVYTSWGKNFKGIDIQLGTNVERLVAEVSALPEFQAAYKKENIEFN